MGHGKFQDTVSIVKRYVPDEGDWRHVKYNVFDLPSDYAFLAPGKINNPQWTKELPDMRDLAPARLHGPMNFHKVCRMIQLCKIDLGSTIWVKQHRLPLSTNRAVEEIGYGLQDVVIRGGEGLVLRKPESVWEPKRSHNCLKVKPLYDSEAKVIGFVWGKGKLNGLMGAMIVEWEGKTFELSGFTDEERRLYVKDNGYDLREPGVGAGMYTYSALFGIGSTVTFHYVGLTKDGIPKEARFWRKAE
jgi:DNA ligase-1